MTDNVDDDKVVDLKRQKRTAGAGIDGVRDMLSGAKRENRRKRDVVRDPAPGDPLMVNGQAVPPGGWTADRWGLAPNCPIGVLGKEGGILHLADSMGQLRSLPAEKLGQKTVQEMVGDRQDWLYWAFPRWDKGKKLAGWRNEQFVEMICTAAARRGLWSAVDRVRGLGMWCDDAGKLLFHAGDAIYRQGELDERHQPTEPGAMPSRESAGDPHFYPARPSIAPPYSQPVTDKACPAIDLYRDLQTWSWEREFIDPLLMLGANGAAMLGGALPWRPTTFLVGDAGVGKSHLNRWLAGIHGRSLLTTKDATAPSIYRLAGADSLPIAVDELEATAEDNRRQTDVLKLARQASDGAKIYRTAPDGGVSEFTVHGSFFFSAINQPPLYSQDYSRMIVLSLRKLRDGATRKAAPTVLNPNIGPMLRRRLMDEWPRFPALFEAYGAALALGGHGARGQDTFGTALTCAHMLLGDEALDALGLPYEDLDKWGEWLSVAAVPELANAQANWLQALRTMMTSRVEAWRDGHRRSVAAVVEALEMGKPNGLDVTEARVWLHQAGIGVADKYLATHGYVLAIPHSGEMVAALFKNSVFGKQGTVGVWAGALRQAPGDVVLHADDPIFGGKKNWDVHKVAGFSQRCSLVSMKGLRKVMEGE